MSIENINIFGYEPFSRTIADCLTRRFALVKEIAMLKYSNQLNVVDTVREEQLITDVKNEAQLLHLPVPLIEELMKSQIDMSKHYQGWLIGCWKNGVFSLSNNLSKPDLLNLRYQLGRNDILFLELIRCARISYGRDLALSLILELYFSHPSIEDNIMKRFKMTLYRTLCE